MANNNNENDGRLNGGVEVEGKPIQLISLDENKKLVVHERALNILRRLRGNVAVCVVVGPYRTGKSYILNLLLNRSDGFDLGDSVLPCKHGIWMWDKPITFVNEHGRFNLLLLDTQGLGSFESSPDSKIFVASLLLASFFVYNTMRVIDRDAIAKLGLIADLARLIDSRAVDSLALDTNDEEEHLMRNNLPEFLWVVRDFSLRNVFASPDEYLSKTLELETSKDKSNGETIKDVSYYFLKKLYYLIFHE